MAQRRRLDRAAALELLRSQHTFPGPYEFRVVVRPALATSVVSAVAAALEGAGAVDSVTERASRKGTYLSVRILTEIGAAEDVLDVYEVIGALDGVLMTM